MARLRTELKVPEKIPPSWFGDPAPGDGTQKQKQKQKQKQQKQGEL